MKPQTVAWILFSFALLMTMSDSGQTADGALDTAGRRAAHIRTVVPDGGRVSWEPGGRHRIAFDRRGDDGFFDVYVLDDEHTAPQCLTCGTPGLPQGQNGQPGWHPSGDFVVFQAQIRTLTARGRAGLLDVLSHPGSGVNCNLWLITSDGRRAWQLTSVRLNMGVLHPHFSHDGRRLVWAERIGRKGFNPLGQWAIRVGELAWDAGRPQLRNIQTLQPGGMQFFETHGFSNDDRSIFFTASTGSDFYHSDIYRYDLQTRQLQSLTDTTAREWDEHAHLSPDGRRIVWMSTTGIPQRVRDATPQTDYWLMNPDGSGKERLTFFNDPAAPEYLSVPAGVTAADVDWSPDGTRILGCLILHPHRDMIVEITP